MNRSRPWVIRTLREEAKKYREVDSLTFTEVGDAGLRVARAERPDALIYCAGVGSGQRFGLTDLDLAMADLPDVQFVVVVPTRIEHEVYARAEEIGICVDGFGALASALRDDDDVASHLPREHAYVTRRLMAHRSVRKANRRGLSAYEVVRPKLPSLTIVTTTEYEQTADDVYSLIEEYSDLDIQAIVITNPSARGISSDALQAGRRADIRVLLLQEFLDTLHA